MFSKAEEERAKRRFISVKDDSIVEKHVFDCRTVLPTGLAVAAPLAPRRMRPTHKEFSA